MTSDHLLFLLGAFMVSAGVSYAWWMRIRVIWLRQDIFDVRDQLFMDVDLLQSLTDPGYVSVRDHLNAIARIAPVLSIPLLVTAIRMNICEPLELPESKDPKVNRMLKAAMKKANVRVNRYLLRETMTGLLAIPAFRFLSMQWMEEAITGWVSKWAASKAPGDTAPHIGKSHSVAPPAAV